MKMLQKLCPIIKVAASLSISASTLRLSFRRKTMQRRLLDLSKTDFLSLPPVKLIAVVCMLLCISSATAFGLQTASGEARQAEIGELKQGQPVEREIAGGAAHTYRITLAAGLYINVIVQQRVDVEVKLIAP